MASDVLDTSFDCFPLLQVFLTSERTQLAAKFLKCKSAQEKMVPSKDS